MAITDAGYNLDSGTSCGFSSAKGSLNSTNAQLGPLQSNGGPTQTMAPALQSPAVDAIPSSVSGCTGSTDQRGVSRPQGAACDIGAVEVIQGGPAAPTGLTATSVTPSSVALSWNASTSSVAGYTVYRNGASIGTATTSTTYTDSTVAVSTTYTYAVDAFDASANHSPQSASISVTTPAQADTIPPTVPTGLVATVSAKQVNLAWNASTDNVGVTGYTIYRNGAALATVSGSTLTYSDTTVASITTYSYTVDAFDAAGNHSAQSAAVSVTTPDWVPPSVPTGLTATSAKTPPSVTLSWNASTDNVGVTGYTVYRNGAALATVSGSTLTYTDTTVVIGGSYSYTVDAFDAAGNHSAQSAPVAANVPSGAAKFVQSRVVTTGSRVTSTTITLGPVTAGDLLIGWFAQYDSAGQVSVSDNVNGAWKRSVSTTWHGGTAPGDIALYYLPNSGAATSGLTITITSTGATYLQGTASEYSGVATVNPLDQAMVGAGNGITADSGLTAAVAAGELVYGGMTATNNAGTLTPGSSQGVTFVGRGQSSSGTEGAEDILVGAAGQQHAVYSFPTSGPWFIVCAVLRPA
jgi:chitodextrinase